MQPIDHPAVWTPQELDQRSDWQQEWTLDECREMLELAPPAAGATAENATTPTFAPISIKEAPALRAKLHTVQHDLEHGSGLTRISGFPLDQLNEQQAAHIFARLMATVGTPLPQTVDGQKLFRVQDEGFAPNHPQARGPSSSKRLSFHTDRCDVLTFLCMRQASEGGENQVVSSMALYNRILATRPDLLQELLEPFAYKRHNVDPGNENAFYFQPVFSFCEEHFAANLLRVLIERAYETDEIGPMPDRKREALDYLEQVAEDQQVVFRQRPGDIVLLNNFVTLHRRNAFVDDSGAHDGRLLFRIWLAVPNSRPLDPSFAASYGATGAGEVRGGMRQRMR